MKNAFEYEAELAALREELAKYRNLNDSLMARNLELTAAEQRNSVMAELLKRGEPIIRGRDIYGAKQLANEIKAALKPTESGGAQ